MRSFTSSVENYISVCDKISNSADVFGDDLEPLLKKTRHFSISADHFVDALKKDYSAYPDIADPFLFGINLIRLANSFLSLEIYRRSVVCQLNEANLNFETVSFIKICFI